MNNVTSKYNEGDKVVILKTESAPEETVGQQGTIITIEYDECCAIYYYEVHVNDDLWFYDEDQLRFANEAKRSDEPIQVKFKKLSEQATIPTYATNGSACFDLYAAENILIQPGETKLVGTGLSFEIPVGYQMKIHPRSGISLKTPLRVANAPGCVDSDFKFEVKVILWNTADKVLSESMKDSILTIDNKVFGGGENTYDKTYCICQGDRIAQAEVVPMYKATFVEVEELTETERLGGFGSSGNR